MMGIRQVAFADPRRCGIALFARTLQAELGAHGVAIRTERRLPAAADAEMILIHHHPELIDKAELLAFCRARTAPVVLFAHDEATGPLAGAVDGVVAMCAGMAPTAGVPVHLMRHPARVPAGLHDRRALRRALRLPADALILGSSGFLKFDREFDIIAGALLEAGAEDWLVQLATSPWRLKSAGLPERLAALGRRYPGRFVHVQNHLPFARLNRRLQACDLLWCWTRAPSSPYASGVASDQYASGTRMVVADKLQHSHVLALPNVVRAPDTLVGFIDCLIAQARSGCRRRHDPSPLCWGPAAAALAAFLADIATRRRACH